MRTVFLSAALILPLALNIQQVRAQISGSLDVMSDYRYRGISLSDNKPAVRASINYDAVNNWYAGASTTSAQLGKDEGNELQLLVYLGRAILGRAGYVGDAGIVSSVFSHHRGAGYTELYLGITQQNITGRIAYSPNYFGLHSSSIYAEMNMVYPPDSRFRLLGHFGVLHGANYRATTTANNNLQPDFSAGVALDFGGQETQLTWSTLIKGDAESPLGTPQRSQGWMLMISHAF